MKRVLASVLFMCPFHAFAQQTYVVGVEAASFLPHYSVDAEGNYKGFARDLLDMFAEQIGVRLAYKPLPADGLLPALLEGEVDFKYPDNPNWAAPAKADYQLYYSQPAVDIVDGVMVAPRRVGLGLEQLRRLAVVDGWTPWGYEARIKTNQMLLVSSDDLPHMMRQALLKDADGAYYNIVVATYYLDNIRAKPGALVFDPDLPHTRSTYNLSSIKHPELMQRFDQFLSARQTDIAALKAKYRVEGNLSSEYVGLEQWKIDFLERQKAKKAAGG